MDSRRRRQARRKAGMYLSVLDRHFAVVWDQRMSHLWHGQYRLRKCRANYRLIGYAYDFVVLVNGTGTVSRVRDATKRLPDHTRP